MATARDQFNQPINPFAGKPAGYFPQQDQATYSPKLPAAPIPAPNPGTTPYKAPENNPTAYLAPVAAGLSAGAGVQATPNADSAILQSAGSGLAGAASGALAGAAIGAAGGPIGAMGGAAIGGITGIVSGGIQAYLGLKDARAKNREQAKQIAYIKKQNDDAIAYKKQQDALSRSDSQEELRYNRRQNAIASQWKAMQSAMDLMNAGMKDDENLKTLFLQRGR